DRGARMSVDDAVTLALELAEDGQARRESAIPAWASPRSLAAGLSTREWDVLALLITGLSSRLIADRLSISPNTVNKHVASILEKLGARSRGQAIAVVLGLEDVE